MEQSPSAVDPNNPERPIEPRQDGNDSDEKKPKKSWRFWVRPYTVEALFHRYKPEV